MFCFFCNLGLDASNKEASMLNSLVAIDSNFQKFLLPLYSYLLKYKEKELFYPPVN